MINLHSFFKNEQCMIKALLGFFFFITQFSSLNFLHSSLITLNTIPVWHPLLSYHHSIFFTLFVSLIPVTRYSFFIFFPVPRNPNQKGKKYIYIEQEHLRSPNLGKRRRRHLRSPNPGKKKDT